VLVSAFCVPRSLPYNTLNKKNNQSSSVSSRIDFLNKNEKFKFVMQLLLYKRILQTHGEEDDFGVDFG